MNKVHVVMIVIIIICVMLCAIALISGNVKFEVEHLPDYIILTGKDNSELESKVNEYTKKNYVPLGSPYYMNDADSEIAQAVVRRRLIETNNYVTQYIPIHM